MAKYRSILLTSMRSPYLDSDRVYPPLGLLYLKSALNKAGFEVGLEDEFNFEHAEGYEKWDVFGASVMTPQREASLNFLNFCKQNYPNKPVVIGGPHAKHYLVEVEREGWDHIVPWDGIRSVIDIMNGTNKRVLYDFMSKDMWSAIERPDRLSTEARNLLQKYNYSLSGRKSTTMLTALGCPERCKFCEDAQTAVRWSNLNNIKAELDDIVALGYRGVYIFDDLFAIAMKMIRPICDEMQKRDLVYRCNGQARYFNEDFAKMLAETGCKEIAFGAESGAQQILDNIDKRTTVDMNYRFIELCKKYGIVCKVYLMIGLPGETMETIYATEKFIQDTKPDDFQLSIYYPYKGTKLRDALDKGEVGFDLSFEGEGLGAYGQKGGSTESVVRTSSLTSQQLLEERDRLVKLYRPISHINKWETTTHTDHFFDTHLKSQVEYPK